MSPAGYHYTGPGSLVFQHARDWAQEHVDEYRRKRGIQRSGELSRTAQFLLRWEGAIVAGAFVFVLVHSGLHIYMNERFADVSRHRELLRYRSERIGMAEEALKRIEAAHGRWWDCAQRSRDSLSRMAAARDACHARLQQRMEAGQAALWLPAQATTNAMQSGDSSPSEVVGGSDQGSGSSSRVNADRSDKSNVGKLVTDAAQQGVHAAEAEAAPSSPPACAQLAARPWWRAWRQRVQRVVTAPLRWRRQQQQPDIEQILQGMQAEEADLALRNELHDATQRALHMCAGQANALRDAHVAQAVALEALRHEAAVEAAHSPRVEVVQGSWLWPLARAGCSKHITLRLWLPAWLAEDEAQEMQDIYKAFS